MSGVPIHLRESGNFDIGENAQVELVRNGPGDPENNTQGFSSVIDISSGSLFIRKGATVTATSKHDKNPTVLYMENDKSNLVIDSGGTLNLKIDNYQGSKNGSTYNPVYMAGGRVVVNGTLNIIGENMGYSETHMFYANKKVEFAVGAGAILDIQSDSHNDMQHLLYLGNANSLFRFSDAKRVNLQKNSAVNSSGGLVSMAEGGRLDVSIQNVYQWQAGNMKGGLTAASGGMDFEYEPMSQMRLSYAKHELLTKTGNSILSSIKKKYMDYFTTEGQQRVLFEYVPSPKVKIESIANDNPEDSSSVTIFGTARPDTYIRLWEEAKHQTTPSLKKGQEDFISSPITDKTFDNQDSDQRERLAYADDPLANYTVKTGADGRWSYTICNSQEQQLQANNVINVFGFYNLKSEHLTQIVLDKTAPKGSGVTYYSVKDSEAPEASRLVKDGYDTNSILEQARISYSYENQDSLKSLMSQVSTEEKPHKVQIKLSDNALDPKTQEEAFNSRLIEGKLVILKEASGIQVSAEEITIPYEKLKTLTKEQLNVWLINESEPSAYRVKDGKLLDVTSEILVEHTDDLMDLSKILAANGEMLITVSAPSEENGIDYVRKKVKVKVINLWSEVTVKFVNENNEELKKYTMQLIKKDGKQLAINDLVNLTDPQYGVVEQLQQLNLNGYTLMSRPEKETTYIVSNPKMSVIYQMRGTLFLSSTPNKITFGNVAFDGMVTQIDRGIRDQELIVKDTRATKSKWRLSAKLIKEMTHHEEKTLKLYDSLQYRRENGQLTLNDGVQLIYQAEETNLSNFKVTNISQNWGNQRESLGLKLVLDPRKTQIAKGTYSGVIEWQIMEGVP